MPGSNWNPVVGRSGVPAPASVPGQIVCEQLLTRVKEQEREMVMMSKTAMIFRAATILIVEIPAGLPSWGVSLGWFEGMTHREGPLLNIVV